MGNLVAAHEIRERGAADENPEGTRRRAQQGAEDLQGRSPGREREAPAQSRR